MRPAGQMILCEKLLKDRYGSIVIPENARDSGDTNKVYRMRVVAFGPGIAHNPGAPPVRRRSITVDGHDGPDYIERLTCQEIVGHDFEVGSVLLCSRYNYNCDVDHGELGLGEKRELRLVRAEDVLGVEE